MRATVKAFSFFLVGALAFIAVLTPTSVEAQGTGEDTGILNIAVFECPGLEGPGPMTVPLGVPDDCVPGSGSFDLYLSGDGSGEPVTSAEVNGTTDISLVAGTYTVHETTTDTPAGEFTLVAGHGTAIVFGIPLVVPDPDPPVVTTGTVTASVWHCLELDAPGPLPVVGDDCIPGAGAFDFYLIGDGTDDSWRLTVGEDGVNSITLQVGEYEVYEVTTDTRVSNVVVTAGGNAEISFGIPRVVPPPTETGILSVSTYTCAELSEPVVLGEIGDDCVRISTDLSFYLWGDGTNEFWPLTTSNTAAVDIELPVGDYEVIDEPTQWSVSATVVEEGSSVAFGFPAYQAPVDPVDPVDPEDSDSADSDKAASPVSKLPETGVGTGSNMGALSALLGGAVMAAGALGVRIRKS